MSKAAQSDATGSGSPASADAWPSTAGTMVTPEFSMHYDLHGDPQSPRKLLLIMGLLTDGASWAKQAEFFSRNGFQVVTYDNRGVAQSSTPPFYTYTTRSMAQDALALMNHLGWERVHVVGVSMGGMIALELMLAAPAERIVSLTLMVTHAGGWGGFAPWPGVTSMLRSLFARDDSVRLSMVLRMLYTERTLADPPAAEALRAHHVARIAARIPPKPAGIIGHLTCVYRHYVSYPDLLRIRYAPYPTLVVVGEEDMLVRTSNSYMLANVLGCPLFVVPDGGHGFLAAYPERVNPELLRHFEQGQLQMEGKIPRPDHTPIDPQSAAEGEGDFATESQETLMCDLPSPYSLEERAISLACSHSAHCSLHNVSGFLTAFVPALFFRWIFFDSIALNAVPSVSRWEQSLRFGLLIGGARTAYRALRCILRAYRARQWVRAHRLMEHPQQRDDPTTRKGVPPRAFEFPLHSLLVLAACALVCWKKQLLQF